MRYKTINKFRKTHRFLGVFIGIQFLFWTLSGLYFSWTDIDEIHGDHYRKEVKATVINPTIISDSLFHDISFPIHTLEIKSLGTDSFFWVNDSLLIAADTGVILQEISENQAVAVVNENILPQYQPQKVERITAVGPHDEYRGRPLPAFRISLSGKGNPVAYVAARSGEFQRIRHTKWRWFDFLWMTHTMDYQGRDNFNTLLLRVFSLFGLITVLSGFALAFVSSSWRKKIKR